MRDQEQQERYIQEGEIKNNMQNEVPTQWYPTEDLTAAQSSDKETKKGAQ